MTTLIKLFYAVMTAALLILLVAFGIRTFYPAPDQPVYPSALLAPPASSPPSQAEQQQYQADYDRYLDRRADYHRNVFLAATLIGIAALAGGLMLPSRLDAIRLGLVAGGLGTVLYAVIQAAGDLDQIGATVIFAVVLLGLLLVLGVGYRWLGRGEPA